MSTERALTIRQPWADLVMAGVKDVENRTWPVPRWAFVCPDCGGSGADARACEATLAFVPCPTCDGSDIREDDPGAVWPFRLWVHAGLTDDRDQDAWAEWCRLAELRTPEFEPVPDPDDWDTVPRGALLGSVTVTGCHHADECRHIVANYDADGRRYIEADETCSPDWAEHDAYHWVLADPDPLPKPIPMRGSQGLWTLELALAEPA